MPDNPTSTGDVIFTYDAKPFIAAVDKMTKGMNQFVDNTNKKTDKMSNNIVGGLIKFSAIKGVFMGIVNTVNKFIPEIGQTFDMAKDIISRNLLWPLRKELIPLLQGVFDWVKKNRVMFAQWGTILVSVFKLIKTTFMSVYHIIEPILIQFKNFVKSVFGDSAKTMTDVINMIIFKMSVLIMSMQILLQPLFDTIGKVIKEVLKDVEEFGKGFLEGFKWALKDYKFKALESLSNLLNKIGEVLGKINFEKIGEGFGKTLAGAIEILDEIVSTLLDDLTALFDLFTSKNPLDFFKKFAEKGQKDYLEKGKYAKEHPEYKQYDFFDFLNDLSKNPLISKFLDELRGKTTIQLDELRGKTTIQPVHDAIITKDGKVIQTHPDDNIIATKNINNQSSKKIDIYLKSEATINVTEGNARQAGQQFAGGFEQRIKNVLRDGMLLEGGRL